MVSALALAACGGPLEEDPAVGSQEQALVDLMPDGTQRARPRLLPADWVHSNVAPRAEDRFYAPWPK